MKQPLYYNDDVVGYADDIIIENNRIKSIVFYLFETQHIKTIISKIKNSMVASISEEVDLNNIYNNILYSFELNDNVLKINKKI